MGRWLAALRVDEKKPETATDANRQNPQNPPEQGFGGFGGSSSEEIKKFTPETGEGFGGFGGSASGHIQNFYSLPDRAGWDDEDWQAAFDERAAILEFDAGLTRAEAERLAGVEITEQRKGWIQ